MLSRSAASGGPLRGRGAAPRQCELHRHQIVVNSEVFHLALFTLFTRRACVTLDAKGRYTIKAANVADVVLEENSMVAEPRL